MMRPLAALALLGLAAAPALPARWPSKRYVEWRPVWGAGTIHAGGLTARVSVRWCGKDIPVAEDCPDGEARVAATVSAPGLRPLRMEQDPQATIALIGVGRLTPDAHRPLLVLISENGGSGGCVFVDLAVPGRTAYRHVRLATAREADGALCDADEVILVWPRDRTGHRRAEFLVTEPAFGGGFTSNAASWHPPRVLALEGTRTRDVSADPALPRLFRADMVRARSACEHQVDEAEGACAGYAYDAARSGELPAAWRVIDAQVRRGCRAPAPGGGCYAGGAVTADFRADLAAMLAKAKLR